MTGQEKTGWWGTTLSKLKGALSRTKSILVDSIVEEKETEPSINQSQEIAAAPFSDQLQSTVQIAEINTITAMPTIAPAIHPPIQIDEEYLDNIEEKLIRADIGPATASALVVHLRKEALAKSWTTQDIKEFLKREFTLMLSGASKCNLNIASDKLSIVLVVGVNGTGKTTSIGKLCYRLKNDGKKVLLAAGDTFRAAAEIQLEIWAERAGVDIVRLPEGSDPGAVIYKAIERAKSENYNVLIIDTAGRLHNKANLMAELKKVCNVIEKHAKDLPLESLLVIDASVGQNGLQQAKVFTETCNITGVILTKLDGSAKGGIVFSIAKELNLPIKLVGLGEKIDDLRDFDPELFIEALF